MPYLAEKIIDMLYNIIKHGEERKDGEDDVSMDDVMKVLTTPGVDLLHLSSNFNEAQVMRLKIGSIARVRRMYKNLKEN